MSAKSICKDIKSSVAQLDALLNDQELKPGKRADIVMEKARLQALLLQHERDESEDAAETKIAELTAQHEASAAAIEKLKAENASLRSQPTEVRIERDPEHTAVRYQNAALTEAIEFACSSMTDDERALHAVRATQTLSQDAFRHLCDAMKVDWKMYLQMVNRPNSELQIQVTAAQVRGPAAIAAEMILADRGVKIIKQDDLF